MRVFSRVVGLVLSLFVSVGSLAVVAAPAHALDGVSPTLACVTEDSPATFTTRFGYINTNGNTVTIPVGATNYFDAAQGIAGDLGQKTIFLPGDHPETFTVTQPKTQTYSWTLLGQEVVASWSSSPRCADAAETVTREPDLVGVPAVGETVTAAGEQAVLNAGTHTESVQWVRDCDSATPVPVGTGRTYVLAPADSGSLIQAVIDYRDPTTGSGVTWHTPCDAAALVGEKPTVTATPTVSGSAVAGTVLSLQTPSLSGSAPLTTSLEWESCDSSGCTSVGTGPTYTPVASDVGRTVRAQLTVVNAWGSATRTSAPSYVVSVPPSGPVIIPPSGAVSVGPASLTFTTVAGTTSAAQTVTYANATNSSQRIAAVTVTGEAFRRTGGDCYARVVLAAGESCTVDLAFAPDSDGTLTGGLTIDDGTPYPVALSGTATPGGELTVSTAALSFGKVSKGKQAARAVRVSNTGSQLVSINAITLTGAQSRDFTAARGWCLETALAPGSSCLVTVTFRPRATGVRRAVLTIRSSAVTPERVVALSGRGR